ncbi:MAG: RtcB family protein [Chloroflexi bacterium]|nr:RtcB family protein [Chloroflexota bacterium]
MLPSAVGVDIGCGMIAVETSVRRESISVKTARKMLGRIRELVPAGVGQGHEGTTTDWQRFHAEHGDAPGAGERILERAGRQFGTLGSGNHFAEFSEDRQGFVWAIVHSGSRGPGNMLAQHHIGQAKEFVARQGIEVEHRDLSYLIEGAPEFDAYIADMLWAQVYAYEQRASMMSRMLEILDEQVTFDEGRRINCHHNYSEQKDGAWLSRKGAIAAGVDDWGVIPGSMGAATYIVRGKANPDSYSNAPHGAGRLMGRGVARRQLSLDEFKAQMGDRAWLDRDAKELLDEAPGAYKPIEQVMKDAETLVETIEILSQFVNYKGL